MVSDDDRQPTESARRYFGSAAGRGCFTTRTVERQGAFFLPYLTPGMRVLDAGCGPGSITVGLAAAVAPGEAVGIHREASAVEQARAHAAERGVANVRFDQGDLFALPFPDASFDAAFLHAVLEHLPDPVAALVAIRRVVRPGGVIGVRSPDLAIFVVEPADPVLEASIALFARWRAGTGGQPYIGRSLRAVLRAAGLEDVEASMSMDSYGTLEGARAWADGFAAVLTSAAIAEQMVALGAASPDELDHMATAWRAWAKQRDTLFAVAYGEAVGHVTEGVSP